MRAIWLVPCIVLFAASADAAPWWKGTPPVDANTMELDTARAHGQLADYWIRNKNDLSKSRSLVHAAYELAGARIVAGDAEGATVWLTRTVDTFTAWRKSDGAARGTAEAELAAEAAFWLVDARIEKDWHPSFPKKMPRFWKGHQRVLVLRLALLAALDAVGRDYGSARFAAVAHARAGELLELEREALIHTRMEPELPKQTWAYLAKLAAARATFDDPKSTPEALEAATKVCEKDALITQNTYVAWARLQATLLAEIDASMIDRYARAWASARQLLLSHPSLRAAAIRLAYWEWKRGDLGPLVKGVEDAFPGFHYQRGMFLQARPGALGVAKG